LFTLLMVSAIAAGAIPNKLVASAVHNAERLKFLRGVAGYVLGLLLSFWIMAVSRCIMRPLHARVEGCFIIFTSYQLTRHNLINDNDRQV
ncbi:hypothetical protein ACTXGQ_27060, partial [Marinobacter sp. 1Y8]